MWKEFKIFISRGNIVDIAVAFIIGAAFGKIVASFVNDILMPPIGLLLGRVDFSNLFVNLSNKTYPSLSAAKAAGAPVIAYGTFLNTIIEFIIISFAVFFLIQMVNKIRSAPQILRDCPYCLSKIPVGAKRCPACTSELPTQGEETTN